MFNSIVNNRATDKSSSVATHARKSKPELDCGCNERLTKRMFALSVGCGGNLRYKRTTLGDVNLDMAVPMVKISNFVRGDTTFLPFRDKVFCRTVASHLIEHLENPLRCLEEAKRVSSQEIILIFPHYLSWGAYRDKDHKWVLINRKLYTISTIMRVLAFVTIRFGYPRSLISKLLKIKIRDETILRIWARAQ